MERRTLTVAGTELPYAYLPYSSEQLDRIVALLGLSERQWPYWLEDWTATYALANALAAEPRNSLRLPALDLGCGSGFLLAFLRQALGIKALAFDFNSDACRMAALNYRLQDSEPSPSRVFCADMSRFPARGAFGLICCGEMLYAEANQAPLLTFLARYLAPGGTAWLADPGRSSASGFAAAAEAAGFRVSRTDSPSLVSDRNVHVYKVEAAFRP